MRAYNIFAVAFSLLGTTLGSSTYSLSGSIPIGPKNTTSVDQSVIHNGTYYLSDRVNSVVHVMDIASAQQVAAVTGFSGLVQTNGKNNYSISGPNGLAMLANRGEVWVGDAGGKIRVISTASNTIIANITAGNTFRADEMAYDAKDGIVVCTHPNEKPPYVSVINAATRSVQGHIMFNNASGLEQPIFDPVTGLFWVSVPNTGANPGGEIASLNLTSMSLGRIITLSEIIPAGIVLGPTPHLFVSASQDQILKYNMSRSVVLDITTGEVIANISGVAGSDQVAYDNNAKLYFAAAYEDLSPANADGSPAPFLAVIDAVSNTLIQSINTNNVTAHSVAVDTTTNKMLVPMGGNAVAIYSLSTTGTNATSTASSTASSTSGASPSISTSTGNGVTQSALSPALAILGFLATFIAAW